MTTDLRTAAQMALNALTNCSSDYGHRCNRCDSEVDEGRKVIDALCIALDTTAQPLTEDQVEQALSDHRLRRHNGPSQLCDAFINGVRFAERAHGIGTNL